MLRLVALAMLLLATLLGTMFALAEEGSALGGVYAARPLEAVKGVAAGALITVTSTLDEVSDNGDCSLREAILAAETDAAVDSCAAGSGADTIFIPAGRYVLLSGQLSLTSTVTLQGSLTGTTILDGNERYRVIYVQPGASVSLRRLQITRGVGLAGPNTDPFYGEGGGIANYGNLLIVDSVIYDNLTSLYGGQYSVHGGRGGGIFSQGVLTVSNSTISGNKATDGVPEGNLHSGVSCSRGGDGGGIASFGMLRLENVTVTNNQAGKDRPNEEICNIDVARTILFGGLYSSNSVSIQNSIIADNEGSDCGGDPITSLGNNLIRTLTGCTVNGDFVRWGAHLGPLQDNGGATLTHALGPKSPAIDAGSCTDSVGITVTVDQRGVARPLGEGCDIGAFESPYTSTFAIITTSLAFIGYQPVPCAENVEC